MAYVAMGEYEVDPISRIEGHLGAKVTVGAGGLITEANVHGNLWRGFENFLVGRRVNDAITFTQRICGVCPVPHGTAATMAADSVLGVSDGYATFKQVGGTGKGVPEAALHIRNLVLASEFLMSSLVHFYHLVAQSYVQGPPIPPWTPYFPDEQYNQYLRSAGKIVPVQNATGTYAGHSSDLWSAVITQYVKALRIRRLTFEAGALFAGRMPMMSNSVAGGVTNFFRDRDDFINKCNAFRGMIEEVGRFVISEYVPLTLALSYLYPEWDNTNNTGGQGWGAGLGNFLAWGGFPQADDSMAITGGWKLKTGTIGGLSSDVLLTNKSNLAAAKASVEANLLEFIPRSRYSDPLHEFDATTQSAKPKDVTRTVPERDVADKYSWIKAPRFGGYPMEVGPFARMVLNGKYLDSNAPLVNPAAGVGTPTRIYADLYTAGGHLDATVVNADLVAGLAGTLGGGAVATIEGHILGLKGGLSTMDRLRARSIESLWMIIFMVGMPAKSTDSDHITFSGGWIDQLKALWPSSTPNTPPVFFRDTAPTTGTVSGYGLVEAPRGALGHFVTSSGGKINSYQCVVPTTWNGSPKDGPDSGVAGGTTHRGAIEQALIDVPFVNPSVPAHVGGRDVLSGVEVLRVAQSFDPCIACAVH